MDYNRHNMDISNNKCLITTGMHRSGTSLGASLLQAAGLSIGNQLLGETVGNLKGHFENLDFLEFHRNVLEENKLHPDGWDLQTVFYQEQYADIAKKIIAANSHLYWGWKDPRTTLFLDFWQALLPNACYLFFYRAPWEVVDSLFRRHSDEIFVSRPVLALKTWKFYNEILLKFSLKNPDKSLLINIDDFISNPIKVLEMINTKFEFKLKTKVPELFDSNHFNQGNINPKHLRSIVEHYSAEEFELFCQLEKFNNFSVRSQANTSPVSNENMMGLIYDLWYHQYDGINHDGAKTTEKQPSHRA